jgi:hypothetical protein
MGACVFVCPSHPATRIGDLARGRGPRVSGSAGTPSSRQVQPGCAPWRVQYRDGRNFSMTTCLQVDSPSAVGRNPHASKKGGRQNVVCPIAPWSGWVEFPSCRGPYRNRTVPGHLTRRICVERAARRMGGLERALAKSASLLSVREPHPLHTLQESGGGMIMTLAGISRPTSCLQGFQHKI